MTLILGLTAVLGGLIGATVGAVTNYRNTSRQIDRQERDTRRDIYSDFLAAYLSFSQHQSKQDSLEHEHAAAMDAASGYRAERAHFESSGDLESAAEIEKAEAMFTSRADRLSAQYEVQIEQFDGVFNRFLVMNHRVKIGAPVEIYEASLLLYRINGLLIWQDLDSADANEASEWADRTLRAFSALARADVCAPGAQRWHKAVQQEWPALAELSRKVAPKVTGCEPLSPNR